MECLSSAVVQVLAIMTRMIRITLEGLCDEELEAICYQWSRCEQQLPEEDGKLGDQPDSLLSAVTAKGG